MRLHNIIVVVLLLTTLLTVGSPTAGAQSDSYYFPETGHTIGGRFLQYWQQHGGLAQQGYPLSDEVQERSDTDGKVYTVQYFERAVFELHPENQPPNDVLLSLLGNFRYQQLYPNGAPNQQVSAENPRHFAETGKFISGKFRAYWEQHGGLAQQGYPISNEFQETGTDGVSRTVQYFERAVFEMHPENADTPYDVLLTQLGTLRYHAPLPNMNLFSLSMVSPTEGWAVGDKGVILHYTGGRWRQTASPVQAGYLGSISMTSPTDGWAVGGDNVLRYSNGVWQDASNMFASLSNGAPSPYRHGLSSVDMISPDAGWMIANGDFILRYSNGQWTFDYSYGNPKLTGAILANLKMLSANEGWAVGSLDILHYQNGSWTTSYSPVLGREQSIGVVNFAASSSSDVWAVGVNGLLMHYNGSEWSVVPSVTGETVGSAYMISLAEGWAVGGEGTILHYSGNKWTTYNSPTSKSLNAVKMVSPTEGWAVGEAGTILHYENGTWSIYQQ